MSSNASIQEFFIQVVAEFTRAFDLLTDMLQSRGSVDSFLGIFGWKLETGATIDQVRAIFGNLSNVLGNIKPLRTKLLNALKNNQTPDLADFQQLITLVKSVMDLVNKIRGNPLATLEPFNKPKFQNSFPNEVMEYLVFRYVEWRTPRLFGLLYLLGVFHQPEPDATRPRPNYTPCRTNWHMLSVIFSAPKDVFKEAYSWGQPGFGSGQHQLMTALFRLMAGFQIPAALLQPGELDLKGYYDATNPNRKVVLKLNAPLVQRVNVDEAAHTMAFSRLDLDVLPVPPHNQKGSAPAGLAVYPFLNGKFDVTAIPLTDRVKISMKGGFESAGGIWVELYPEGASVSTQLNAALAAEIRLLAERPNPDPWILVGRKESTHIWLAKAHLALQAKGAIQDIEVIIETAADAAAFVLNFGEGDGFLNKIFGQEPQVINLATTIQWSSQRGLTLSGASSVDLDLALHQSIGDLIRLENLLIRLTAGNQTGSQPRPVLIQVAVSGGVTLGPLVATVERVGVQATLTFPQGGGNLGPANLELGFKPPSGAGLSIDAKAVVGGGYLFFDSEKEQYAGLLQLEIQKVLSIKAIGLLTTRLPDGSKGFSLLVIITAEFPPIQLGFGFSLNGLGGLLGVNRTMVLDALRAGIQNRALDSIMFPKDPVANAQKIISDLQHVFPPAAGRFVFGPMAKLAWGTPPILTLELGIVLELPSPVRLAIMGQLSLVLPSQEVEQEAQVVVLHMDVLGTIDFGAGEAAIDATIYDSRIAKFAISGDMALRVNWGASPTFILSVGGFNPRFQPPPNFPSLDRLAITLATGDNPRLRLESYMALTSNTVQFGARLDVYAEADLGVLGRFSAAACLGFDALIHFPPFSLMVDIYGGVTIKRNGTSILSTEFHLTLSGPGPWHAWGEATVEFLGAKCRIPIDLTVGDEAPPAPLPPGDPLGALREALADTRNWSAQLPGEGHMLVTLRKIEASAEALMHPFGELTFRQKVMPLDIAISKFGSTRPSNAGPFTISSVLFDGQSTQSTRQTARDLFAPGQFFDLTDEEKLSWPAFQSLPSGCTHIGTAALRYPLAAKVTTPFEYDTTVIDNKEEQRPRGIQAKYKMTQGVLEATASLGAAGQSAMRSTGSAKFAGDSKQKVKISDPDYVVTSTETMRPETALPSYVEAEAARRAKGAQRDQYQVVGKHEVA